MTKRVWEGPSTDPEVIAARKEGRLIDITKVSPEEAEFLANGGQPYGGDEVDAVVEARQTARGRQAALARAGIR